MEIAGTDAGQNADSGPGTDPGSAAEPRPRAQEGAAGQRDTGSWVWETKNPWIWVTGSWQKISDATMLDLPPDSGAAAVPPGVPYAEPPTSIQMMGLRQLQYLSEVQESAIATALIPVRKGPKATLRLMWEQRTRLLLFVVNGSVVFLIGLAIQLALIRFAGLGHVLSYVIQTVLSVQLNFALSRYLTWRDRRVAFRSAFVRFNVQQLASTGLGMALYAGLDKFGMNYIAANIAVTAVLVPVSFAISHNWSLSERAGTRVRLAAVPWPLIAMLAVQVLLSLRLIWSNSAFLDEATYLYAGGQELNHWLHGVPVEDYEDFFSGSPAVYPPLGALANAVGGLAAARLLSLVFMMGTTALLYATAGRLFGKRAAVLGTALFVSLGVTQFLSAFATFDPMALFLLTLAAYLVTGRVGRYDTLTDVANSTVVAGLVLALANADKYATALWDPVVVGLAWCAPVVAGRSWRYGLGRALRFTATVAAFIAVGLAIGKGKYIEGITSTTLDRSRSQIGMGQPASLIMHLAWTWIGPVIVVAAVGVLMLIVLPGRLTLPARPGRKAPMVALGVLFLLATLAAPLNQARIGTTVSLQKHVDFGAWFGCVIAGYALSLLLRYRPVVAAAGAAIVLGFSVFYTAQATSFYSWSKENPEFTAALRPMLNPGPDTYLIDGFSWIPSYYAGPDISSMQWKNSLDYAYTDPRTKVSYHGDAAYADAIKNRAFTLVIINFTDYRDDNAIAADIEKYGGYQFVGHLPPSTVGSRNYYTVWRVTKGK